MAVYTHVTDTEIREILSTYDVGDVVECWPIAQGVENSNYLLITEHGKFIFTIFESRINYSDLPFYLKLMEHLNAKGVVCPHVVTNKDGEEFAYLKGKPYSIVTFLHGESVEVSDIKPYDLVKLGTKLADLHVAGQDFPLSRSNDFSVKGWMGLYKQIVPKLDKYRADIDGLISKELEFLQHNWPKNLPASVIHGDLFPDNVFFANNDISGIIDFYFACNDFLSYDIAICINAWCFPGGKFCGNLTQKMLEAYSRSRALTSEEMEYMPVLLRGAAMRFLLTRLYDWIFNSEGDALVTNKDPSEYIDKLVFHMGKKNWQEYGINL